ncbi:MAG TPA: RagB/SusD family nutrient uptake outer membrane protein [Chitinophagaceae bacterium]|nr:RagB/SusD family nutrient uptake outer membrane protein [Chitinophagaceae bacterium]
MRSSFLKMIITFLIACPVCYLSCNEKNLDLLPHGPTEQSYFIQESDFTKAVLGIYAKMTDFFWYNAGQSSTTIPAFLLPGDDITTNDNGEEFEQFGPLQPSSGRLNYLYTAHYQMIARANLVLQKINEVADGIYKTPNLKNYHKGEALFLRGYAYYNLWNFFGTSPLDTTRVTSDDQFTPPGTTGTQLLDQAISDFSAAAGLLPATWDDADRGRVTASSANGMLGKSLVFRASATNNNADYTAAITALNKISGAALTSNFNDNFNYATENNEESLFEFQASQAFAFDNVWLSNDFDNAVGNLSIFWGFYDNNFALFGTSQFYGTQKLLNAFNANDPRRDSTLNPSDRSIKKYVSNNKLSQSGVGSVNNYRILRYADVLLLKAEATLQSGGSTAEAIGYINEVRTRARTMGGGTEPANYSTAETDKAAIMNWIINERLLELAGEGQRWFDLRRWQMQGIINLDNAFFSANTSTMSFQLPKHLNFPIPNGEIDVNPNVQQNPGY